MRISPTPQPGEERLDQESRAFLTYLRRVPPVPEEDNPNGWWWQIRDHLRRSPADRLARWASFSDGVLRMDSHRLGVPHVSFDPLRVLRILSDRGVSFVLVGMGAGYLQGAPYPSYNIDITPSPDPGNAARLDRALAALDAKPLKRDEWGPVEKHSLPGFRRLMTAAGMVNVVDALPGTGGYAEVIETSDLLEIAEGLAVAVASLEVVIRSKEAVGAMIVGEPPYSRMMDRVHVRMCKETLAAKGTLVS